MEEKYTAIRKEALKAREKSYCPYSKFAVGAALLSKGNVVYTGANIENASYGATVCAERTAFFKAVSEGETEFEAIAIAGGKKGEKPVDYAYPCGVCRQVMREFCNPASFKIFVVISENEYEEYTLEEMLPKSFGPDNLK